MIAEAGFLFSITAVNMSLASLAGLVVALRRGGAWAAYDLYRLRQIVEFGFANALFALALVPLAASVGPIESAVRIVASAAFVYFVADVLILLRRWRGVSGEYPIFVVVLDLTLIFVLVTTAVLGTVAAWEWVLLALTVRPMAAFLFVLATLRSEGG